MQYISVSNHYTVRLKCMQCYMSTVTQEARGEKRKKKKRKKISGVQLRNGKLLGGGGGVYFSLEQTETHGAPRSK